MASTGHKEMHLKCPICFDVFKEPRKLPGCSHSFCEGCILAYVLNLKKEDNLRQTFECPVCRLPTAVPDNTVINIEWVRRMEKSIELLNMNSGEQGDDQCSPCKFLDKTTISTHYCVNCQEHFCASCSKTWHAGKLNRDHTVIEISRQKSVLYASALKLLSQLLMCSEHPEHPVYLYCELHGDLVCSICAATTHTNCRNLQTVKEMPKSTLETESDTLIQVSEKLLEHVKMITAVYKENATEIKLDVERIRTRVQEIKQNVLRLFDILEDNLNTEGGAKAKELTIECLDKTDTLNDIEQKINVCRCLIQEGLHSSSEENAFICINKIKRMIQQMETEAVQKGSTFTKRGVDVLPAKILNKLLNIGPNDTSKLATIEEKEENVYITHYQNAPLQESFQVEKVMSKNIKSKLNLGPPTYNCLLYLPNSNILLLDSDTGCCCLLNCKYQEIMSKKFASTKDVYRLLFEFQQYGTAVGDHIIALSLTTEKKICFVSANDLTYKGEITCGRTPKAICALSDCEIAVSWEDPVAFGIVVVQGGSYSDICYFTTDQTGRQLKSFDYMAADKKLRHIIQPCSTDNAVYCFTYNGDPVFTYMNEELTAPRGVAVNSDGIILVCNKTENGSIHILSHCGLVIKVIREHCPSCPLAVAFSKDGNQIAVSEVGGSWDTLYFLKLMNQQLDQNEHLRE